MNARLAYLKTEIMTACQPKLRLLLIKAALQLARHSLQTWEEPIPEATFHALSSLRKVVLQLFTSIQGKGSQLGRDIQSLYLYLFNTVTEAQLDGDAQKIRDVVKVLEVERETWQNLTERFVAELAALRPSRALPRPAAASQTLSPLNVRRGARVEDGSFSILA